MPISAPIPAVTAIASAPQNATRSVGLSGGAPPSQALSAPSAARKTSDAAGTAATVAASGARKATKVGSAAPTEKLTAEAKAASSPIGAVPLVQPELVARVGAQRVRSHELLGDLTRERRR